MGHHNYPKTRKCRDTSYAKSTKLLNIISVERFKEIFAVKGIYLAARQLSEELNMPVSPYVCRYIRNYKLNK